jgi:hypothetical protein
MRPTDAQGFRDAWDILERIWGETVEHARTFTADQLHERVDGEWSFIETLRHLVFATDAWVCRALLGDPEPEPYAVRRVLRTVLNEVWLHRQYAERDLAVIAARAEGRRDPQPAVGVPPR